jgi:hypothetical protein
MSKLATSEAAPHLYEFIDRAQTEMPDWYMPSAEGVLIAGEEMLRAAGPRRGAADPGGWSRGTSGFKKTARDGKTVLWVQQCGSYWIVERSRHLDDGRTRDEALVCAFGSVPIWAPTCAAAMFLHWHRAWGCTSTVTRSRGLQREQLRQYGPRSSAASSTSRMSLSDPLP